MSVHGRVVTDDSSSAQVGAGGCERDNGEGDECLTDDGGRGGAEEREEFDGRHCSWSS